MEAESGGFKKKENLLMLQLQECQSLEALGAFAQYFVGLRL